MKEEELTIAWKECAELATSLMSTEERPLTADMIKEGEKLTPDDDSYHIMASGIANLAYLNIIASGGKLSAREAVEKVVKGMKSKEARKGIVRNIFPRGI